MSFAMHCGTCASVNQQIMKPFLLNLRPLLLIVDNTGPSHIDQWYNFCQNPSFVTLVVLMIYQAFANFPREKTLTFFNNKSSVFTIVSSLKVP